MKDEECLLEKIAKQCSFRWMIKIAANHRADAGRPEHVNLS